MRLCFFFAISACSSSSLRRSVDAGSHLSRAVSSKDIVDELESYPIYEITDPSGIYIDGEDGDDSGALDGSEKSIVSAPLTSQFFEEMEPWFTEENVDGAARSFLETFSEKDGSAMLKETRKGLAVGILLAFLLEIAASRSDLSQHFEMLGKLDIKSVRGTLLLIDFVLRGVLHVPQLMQRFKRSGRMRYSRGSDDSELSSVSSEEKSDEVDNEKVSLPASATSPIETTP